MPAFTSPADAEQKNNATRQQHLDALPRSKRAAANAPVDSVCEAEEAAMHFHQSDVAPQLLSTLAVSPSSPAPDERQEGHLLHGSCCSRSLPPALTDASASVEVSLRPTRSAAHPPQHDDDDCMHATEQGATGQCNGWENEPEMLTNSLDDSDKLPGDKASTPARATMCGLFRRHNLELAAVPFVCGLINGFTIGYVAPYTQLCKMATDCSLYTAKGGCESVPFADCVWHETTMQLSDGTTKSLNYCGWPSITCRAAYPNDGWVGGGGNTALAEMQCLQDSRCTWSYRAKECQNPAGYSVSYTGLFAGSIIAGSMVGAILGGPLVTSMGIRLTFLLSGLMSCVCSVMGHVDAASNEFWVLVVERFVIGVFMGLITVACPLYVNTNAEPLYRRKLGTLFQVFTTLGVLVAATIGLGVGQSVEYGAERDADISGRMQGLASGQTALSLAMILLGIFTPESKVKYGRRAGGLNQSEYSYRDMMGPLIMSVVLNCTMRLTGFNAILNFAPSILGSFGLAPLVGNMIMTIFNFTGTLVSIPLESFFAIRSIFLFGSCFISCMCLFLCGIPVYPGVASDAVTNGCAIAGIIFFIFGFEVFVGPSFYVLCQEIFPPSFRPRGNSFAQLWQFVFNLVINVCYPMAAERFSGGPGGNQHKGQSIIFMFFGGVGLFCFVIEFFFLNLWDDEKQRECAAQPQTLEAKLPDVYAGASGATAAASTVKWNANAEVNALAPDGGEQSSDEARQ
ncbi:putative transport protein [Leptomonas seymouri]|uniref:Putative transport protein n=1 Tax=Leptomonas seymouri TaxID=5684 RepID=A0A0N0P4D8_LEPSE|nr:putative transport protein [Leptomonas seymouri]|eukprot:KPI84717.1 putative transport protein [Leptomonas seymouri]